MSISSEPSWRSRTTRRAIEWPVALGIALYHAVAMLAFLPWFFSWSGVACAFFGSFIFGTLGINIGFHRLLSHRSFATPKWVERTLALLGICCLQESPVHWVAVHRRHHQHADDEHDPHSPLESFFWAHVGWILVKPDITREELCERYAKDLMRDPFYAFVERTSAWIWIVLISWAAFFLAGLSAGLLRGDPGAEAARFGLSLLVWGVFLRTVLVWHITWTVSSVTHLWGYRTYETADASRNNLFVAILSNGEGWHNNHHAHPGSARQGFQWWELDLPWLIIRGLERVGLAWNVAVAPRR